MSYVVIHGTTGIRGHVERQIGSAFPTQDAAKAWIARNVTGDTARQYSVRPA